MINYKVCCNFLGQCIHCINFTVFAFLLLPEIYKVKRINKKDFLCVKHTEERINFISFLQIYVELSTFHCIVIFYLV